MHIDIVHIMEFTLKWKYNFFLYFIRGVLLEFYEGTYHQAENRGQPRT